MGESVKELREQAGVSYRKAAEYMGGSVGMIQYWEQNNRVPEEHRDRYAELLGVDIERLSAVSPGRKVRKKSQHDHWRTRVQLSQAWGLTAEQKYILMALPLLWSEEFQAVPMTIEELAETIHEDAGFIEQNWGDILDSPFVERVGAVEWLIRLRFPEVT